MASQNLRAGNPDPAATVASLAASGADLIALPEVSGDTRDPVAGAFGLHLARHAPAHPSRPRALPWAHRGVRPGSRTPASDYRAVTAGFR